MSKTTTKRQSRKDFPLTKRSDGRYQKRVGGRCFYFTGTKQEALAEWLRVKDDIYGGHDPRPASDQLTIRDLVNAFLELKEERTNLGKLSQRSYNDYFKSCERVVKVFGPTRLVETLNNEDFKRLYSNIVKGRGPVTQRNEITRVMVLFNHAKKHDLTERPIRGLAALEKPSKDELRAHFENGNGDVLFTREQIHALLKRASPQLRAMVLLGVGNGLGNTDVSKLEARNVDLDKGWLVYPRPKNSIKRVSKLWDETVEALNAIELPFRTRTGGRWVDGSSSDNALSKEFRKLMDDCDIKVPGIGFYRFRHTFRSIADDVKDESCLDLVMGHHREEMASNYRHLLPKSSQTKDAASLIIPEGTKQRLEAVADCVHRWLYGESEEGTQS